MRTVLITLIPLFLSVLSSCSVAEDRRDCPCWLQVDVDGFIPDNGVLVAGYSVRRVFLERMKFGHGEFSVPRGMLGISCISRPSDCVVSGNSIMIKKGGQADSLFAHAAVVNCEGESASDTVYLHKQFATVELKFAGNGDSEYAVRVLGDVAGMDIVSLTPLDGDFDFRPAPDSSSHSFSFRLPRQKSSSLMLEISLDADGRRIDALPLGKMIEESGYDWSAEDLDDMEVFVDYARVGATLHIMDWDVEIISSLEI